MNPAKQHRKLHKLLSKAEVCLTRDEAQKILKKAAKTQRKLEKGPSPETSEEPFSNDYATRLVFE